MATVNVKLTPEDGWTNLEELVGEGITSMTVTAMGGTVELAEADATPTVKGHPLHSSCSANYTKAENTLYGIARTTEVSLILT